MLNTLKAMKVNTQNSRGCTALICAVRYERPDIVDLLLRRTVADVSLKDDWGCTAFSYADVLGLAPNDPILQRLKGFSSSGEGGPRMKSTR
jgi:ankyrin repeat protein